MNAPAQPLAVDGDAVLQRLRQALAPLRTLRPQGRVLQVQGTLVRAVGVAARLGELVELHAEGQPPRRAEVIAFDDQAVLLAPLGPVAGLSPGARVVATHQPLWAPTGPAVLGRVLDGFGQPLDGRGPLVGAAQAAVDADPPQALRRRPLQRPFETGVRAIDALLACAEGQRLGIFAPPGAGKTTLIGALARHARCDVNVIALIGERGREVGEFITQVLGSAGLARSVVVVATSDRSALERARAAQLATAVAEGFRERGARVLLVMDSLTRYARALRELGLAAGEAPVRRGFPPSVFAQLPRLLERAGCGERGSITAFYTVLTEGSAEDDPVAEEARAVLDGHLLLSRELAEAGRWPAIDVLASLSRAMPAVAAPGQVAQAQQLRRWLAKHRDIEMLLAAGEWQRGEDPLADAAVQQQPAIRRLLEQAADQPSSRAHTLRALAAVAEGGGHD